MPELVVLADTVHNHNPLNLILRRNCFWFASTVCDVIVKEYPCKSTSSKQFAVSNYEICIPPNDYLPDLAGRWMGILVSHIEKTISLIVASNFRKYHQEKLEGSFAVKF